MEQFCQTSFFGCGIESDQLPTKSVNNASRKTGFDEFVESCSVGYKDLLGTGGANLSDGQKQKLNLTRELLANPQILLLDEAASSLDNISEVKIEKLFRRLKANAR